MPITKYPLFDKQQTADEIAALVLQYSGDLRSIYIKRNGKPVSVRDLPLDIYFNLVKNIPYKLDPSRPHVKEIIGRPYRLFKMKDRGLDCKKKSILCGAWAKENSFDYRFMGSSQRADRKIHHIFPQIFYGEEWRNFDATYPEYELFGEKNDLTNLEVLA